MYYDQLGGLDGLTDAVLLEAGCGGGIVTLYAWVCGIQNIVAYDQNYKGVTAPAIPAFQACFSANWQNTLPSAETFASFFVKHSVDIRQEMTGEELLPREDITTAHFVICLSPPLTEHVIERVTTSPRARSTRFLTVTAHSDSIAVVGDLVPKEAILLKTPTILEKRKSSTTLFVIEVTEACRQKMRDYFVEEEGDSAPSSTTDKPNPGGGTEGHRDVQQGGGGQGQQTGGGEEEKQETAAGRGRRKTGGEAATGLKPAGGGKGQQPEGDGKDQAISAEGEKERGR